MEFEEIINTTNGSSSHRLNNDSFDNMYPALIQCFGIIILGYIAGRLGMINRKQATGLSKFALNATLPAFIFRAIVLVDFPKITWKFVLVVLFAKILVFVAVCILTLLFTRNIGKAGIYAVFCTVSNDLAMGIPVLKSMFEETHKEFIDCLHFLVLVSLAIITPVGILMMEFEKQRTLHTSSSVGHILLKTAKALLLNPVILGSIFAIPCNYILNQDIPRALDKFLETLAQAFPAAALFYLGLIVVGRIKTQVGMAILVPLSLVSAKVLILPLMIRALLGSFNVGESEMNGDWKIVGFIYGTIPPAPTSVVFAGLFGIQEDMLASALMMATAFSAPVMFSSSKMASVYHMNLTQEYRDVLADTRNSISYVAIGLACWTIIILILSGRSKFPPHRYTMCLTITQLLLCVSFVLTKSERFMDNKRLACFLITTFLLGTHCWTAVLAVALSRIRCSQNDNSLLKKIALYSFGWGLPLCCSSILIAGLETKWKDFSWDKQDFFYFVQKQVVFSTFWVIVLFICVFLCISSLVYLHRCDNYCKCLMYKEEVTIDENTPLLLHRARRQKQCHRCPRDNDCSSSLENPSIEESLCGVADIGMPYDLRKTKLKNVNKNRQLVLQKYYGGEKHQSERHIIVILCQILLFILCIFYCMWILVNDEQSSGIFLEIELLVSIVLSGQVLAIFAMFGFERALIIDPFLQRLRRYWYGVNEVIIPKLDDLPTDEYHICKQFVYHHKEHCARDLSCRVCPVDNSGDLSVNNECSTFLGSELVDWLLEVGLVSDRVTAVNYGNSLLRGHVIQHVDKLHYFSDSKLLCEFCLDWESRS